nr:LLM class flavin-dependent oxidoreductase [Actinopolyspora erythraea]
MLKAIWPQEEAEFHGEHVSFGPLRMWPKPVQRPHPPIYMGGHSRAAVDRLVEHGDGWLPNRATPAKIRRVREALADQGRDDVTVNVPAKPEHVSMLDAYATAGADRVVFPLDVLPESDALRELDELAALTTGRGGSGARRPL